MLTAAPTMLDALSSTAIPIYNNLKILVAECLAEERSFDDAVNGFSSVPPSLSRLQSRAKSLGVWNLFMTHRKGITVHDYALMSELQGTAYLAPYATNCAAPDSGNMEVLEEFGTRAQKERWLGPLMEGDMRSAFLMTEPDVASSDARNVCTAFERATRDGVEGYVVSGRKWWSTGAQDPRCGLLVVLGKVMEPGGEAQKGHTVLLVPRGAAGVKIVRPLTVFGYDDAPFGHAEIELDGVFVPRDEALVLEEGAGFKIAQARLGPGRIHHCMRAIGMARRCFDLMVERTLQREVFGRVMARHGMAQEKIALGKARLAQARAIVLLCADRIDRVGAKEARGDISMIKYAVPNLLLPILDDAIQVHGGMGVCDDTILARAYANMRTLRIADGPDEVHMMVVAREECRAAMKRAGVDIPRSKL
mmetsp:Transcript_16921/g.34434  ORF Transcript_16921/g.34434 Transcript_16921/m.34434 type:complete len:420 (+) Transcript_16921:199-1458(+)